MEKIEETVAILKKLGLTGLEARVYVTLAFAGNLTVDAIAKISKIHRPDIYRLVTSLADKGLIEKIIAKPIQYSAMSIDKCVDSLLQKRSKESMELLKEANRLRKMTRTEKNPPLLRDTSNFVLIRAAKAKERIEMAIDKTQESIDLVVLWNQFSTLMFNYKRKFGAAWSRGVKTRFIIEKPKESAGGLSYLNFCRKNHFCELKFILTYPPATVMMFDQREVFIIEDPTLSLLKSSILASNSPSLCNMSKYFFEKMWLEAEEYQPQINKVKPIKV